MSQEEEAAIHNLLATRLFLFRSSFFKRLLSLVFDVSIYRSTIKLFSSSKSIVIDSS